MDAVTEVFLALLSAGLRELPAEQVPELTAAQWRELFSLAQAHKVLTLILAPVYPQLSQTDPALAAGLKGQVRQQIIAQTLRTAEFLELYRALEEAGVTPLVVKGIVCRQLYPKPDHRPSSDEDLLILPEQFGLCHRTLEAQGMAAASGEAYEVPYRRPDSPLYIELHKQLFPPKFGTDSEFNGFFRDAFRNAVMQEVPDGRVRTMCPTDHMTYLLFHAFKHFLHSGFGIRQICDIALFAHHHNERIDWERVLSSCRSIRADGFAAAVFAIGFRHLGFGPVGPWAGAAVDELPLLHDVLRSGIYGSAERSRLHSSTITLEAAASGKQKKSAGSGILAAAFPNAKSLEGRYPWLKKQPWLLPVAWASRMSNYLLETRHRPDSSVADALKIGTERLELLKQYHVLK